MRSKELIWIGAVILMLAIGCEKRTPSEQPLPAEGFKAQLVLENPPSAIKSNLVYKPRVHIKNNSRVLWPSLPGKQGQRYWIRLAYRWHDLQGNFLPVEIVRTDLPHDLGPNEEVTVTAKIIPPERSGEYLLEIDLVQEEVDWFKNPQSQAVTIKVRVE